MRTFQKFQKRSSKSLLIETPMMDNNAMRNWNYNQTEFSAKPTTQLYCPSCYNKNVRGHNLPSQPNEGETLLRNMKDKDEINFQDNHKKENEDYIKNKIADREQKAKEAFLAIDKFKNTYKEMLQQENESEANFFKATDHNLVRAKNKSKELESLLKRHPDTFKPKENEHVNEYYNKCIGIGNNSCLIKSSSCPSLTKAQYNMTLKNQIALKEKMKIEERRLENTKDKENLDQLLNQNAQILKAKRDHDSFMKKDLAEQYNRLMFQKLKKKNEDKVNDLKKEYEQLNNEQRNINNYKAEMSRKKNMMNNICNYNRKKFLQEKEKQNKDKWDNYKYKNNGYIKDLLCEHGGKMATCADCKKSFPKRVMTPIIIRKKN